MKHFRLVITVTACFFLVGFKKPVQEYGLANKKSAPIQKNLPPKPLDLNVSLSNLSFENASEKLSSVQSGLLDEIPNENPSKTRALELRGRVIVTQEQETEKTNSADGAGILINLRH